MRVPNIVKIRPKPLKYNLQQTARAHVHTNAHTVQFIKGEKKAILQCLRRTKPTLLSSFQNFDESIFGNINVAKFSHLLFALCLTFEQLHLSGDVSTVLKQSKTMHDFHTILSHISGAISSTRHNEIRWMNLILPSLKSLIFLEISLPCWNTDKMYEFHTIVIPLLHWSWAISSIRHNERRQMTVTLMLLQPLPPHEIWKWNTMRCTGSWMNFASSPIFLFFYSSVQDGIYALWKVYSALHCVSQKFPKHCPWNSFNVYLFDDGPHSSFQERSSSASSFHTSRLCATGSISSYSTLHVFQ